MQARVEVRDECRDAGRLAAEFVVLTGAGRHVRAGQLEDEQADARPVLADARDDADEAAVHGVGDPELVGGALGEQPIAAVRLLFDVGLNLLGVHTDADLGEPERHRAAFDDQREKRSLLVVVAVREQRARADRELPGDLDCERPEPVRRERFFHGRELAVRRRRAAELRSDGVAVGSLGRHGATQRVGEAAVGGERLAARETAERRIDHGALGTRDGLRHHRPGLQLRGRGRRAVDQPFDQTGAARAELAVDGFGRAVERADVARGIEVAGSGERAGGRGVLVAVHE